MKQVQQIQEDMTVLKVKIFNLTFFLFNVVALFPVATVFGSNNVTLNGSSITLSDGYYIASTSVEFDRVSDAFISAAKADAQVKIIEDLIFNVIYNSNVLKDIDNITYKNLLCKFAVEKLLDNKMVISGLSEVEHRQDGSNIFLTMKIQKSKFDEIVTNVL